MIRIPQLGLNTEILSFRSSSLKDIRKSLSNLFLVAVDMGTIKLCL